MYFILTIFLPLVILTWMVNRWPPKTLEELIEEDKRKGHRE